MQICHGAEQNALCRTWSHGGGSDRGACGRGKAPYGPYHLEGRAGRKDSGIGRGDRQKLPERI